MIEYIYFVKCPDCEDEHFDFFDEAKEYAMGCLSKKPIITQVEVNRNDFGECTDSRDLGTVWSSDYVIADVDKEPSDTPSLLTKDFLNKVGTEEDPEFAALDNSVDVEEPIEEPTGETSEISEISAIDEVPDNFRKPLTEGNFGVYFKKKEDWDEFKRICDEIGIKTMGDVESFMRQEGATPNNILDKLREYRAELGPDFKIVDEGCRKPVPEDMTIEQLVETMEENEDEVECTWCNELFPKSECRKEVDLGYLCSRCEQAIKSRGEDLTFRENSYWDFLDEDAEIATVSEEPKLRTWTCWYDNKDIGKVEAYTEEEAEEKMMDTFSDEFFFDSFDHDFGVTPDDEELVEHVNEEHPAIESDQELHGIDNAVVDCKVAKVITHSEDEKPVDCEGKKKPLEKPLTEGWIEEGDRFTIDDGNGVEHYIVISTSDDDSVDTYDRYVCIAKDVGDGTFEDEDQMTYGELAALKKSGKLIMESKSFLEDLEEAADYKTHLEDCPECGTEKSFDKETGICINCGFNFLNEEFDNDENNALNFYAKKVTDEVNDHADELFNRNVQNQRLIANALDTINKKVDELKK